MPDTELPVISEQLPLSQRIPVPMEVPGYARGLSTETVLPTMAQRLGVPAAAAQRMPVVVLVGAPCPASGAAAVTVLETMRGWQSPCEVMP